MDERKLGDLHLQGSFVLRPRFPFFFWGGGGGGEERTTPVFRLNVYKLFIRYVGPNYRVNRLPYCIWLLSWPLLVRYPLLSSGNTGSNLPCYCSSSLDFVGRFEN